LDFEDTQIINVVLELITLFTVESETATLIFKNRQILAYTFQKLKSNQKDTLKLSALALSRLAASLDDENSAFFIENLKEFKYFDQVVEQINQHEEADNILMFFLNFLENVTCFKKTRDELECQKCIYSCHLF